MYLPSKHTFIIERLLFFCLINYCKMPPSKILHISRINLKKFSNHVDILKQDYYTKKLTTESFLKIMLFAQLHETESLHAISDALLDEDFQKVVGVERSEERRVGKELYAKW